MSSAASPWISIYSIFEASIRSLGTAVTLASVGFYLHRRGFVSTEGKRTLALISQQVTFPLFLCTKIIYCNQDWSSHSCPDITSSLRDVWMLLVWPVFVVGSGFGVGYMVALLTNTPASQIRAVLAAVAFGNSTGLPITLLTVVHTNFPETSDLGRVDPTLFLSVYLLLYPVLQWGIGGWLLSPSTEITASTGSGTTSTCTFSSETTTGKQQRYAQESASHALLKHRTSFVESFAHNVLNTGARKKGLLSSSDEGLYVSDGYLTRFSDPADDDDNFPDGPDPHIALDIDGDENDAPSQASTLRGPPSETQPLLQQPCGNTTKPIATPDSTRRHEPTIAKTIQHVLNRCFQPPVIGAITGIIVAVTPLRGVFVDIVDRSSHAPLQWLFNGLYSVGLAAVPINMMILGCNLSASLQKSISKEHGDVSRNHFSKSTILGIVVGKMAVMPLIGFVICALLRAHFLDVSSNVAGSFYLVMMIVFLCPTANNVMVMVELSGNGAKEGIASVIALQYAVAPLLMSLTMTIAIGFASAWS